MLKEDGQEILLISNKTNLKSFSLIELMIVITIIAILVAAGIPNYQRYLQRASVAEAVSVMADYKLSIGLFWSIQNSLPRSGDTLDSTPANLVFGTVTTNTTATPLPDSIQSLLLSSSGNGILITAVVQAHALSNIAVNNRTIVLGAKPAGNEIVFACGNFTTNATTITDIGVTELSLLPYGCDYN